MSINYQERRAYGETSSGGEDLSGNLLAMLTEQVSLARNGKVEGVLTLAGKIDRMLHRADHRQLERIWTQRGPVRKLHNELCLMFGAAKREVADELGRLRTGKNLLQAYKKDVSHRHRVL